ncbi:MAG: helix-turn-helix transcriptional regulator [Marinifilum sp.]|nr:helix-turn-helix transcriptional regulator [Marinifilum sp.]
MVIANNDRIPIYNLQTTYDINIEAISHNNQYNFNQIHRHSYYEILFFEKGGGHQFIDFEKTLIKDNSCYIVKPNQVHLIKRNANADGLLIQFTNQMILPDVFLTTLSTLKEQIGSSVLFEEDKSNTEQFMFLLHAIQKIQLLKTTYYKEKSVHLLSNILYGLEEVAGNNLPDPAAKIDKIILKFIELAEDNLTKLTINEYAEKLFVSRRKLGDSVKSQFGVTPLKYIHNLLILNIKRDLVFKKLSLKEIALTYHFDSTSNFSLFVKKHTGYSPSELQKQLIGP